MSVHKIDPESEVFKNELNKTAGFTDKVNMQFGYAYHPDSEIVKSVQFGLTRNKLIYGKRYCPCFFVTQTKGDRLCPCKPAREEEIPRDGRCHCGIFCTPEYVTRQETYEEAETIVHSKSDSLTQEQATILLQQSQLDGEELESLLKSRQSGLVDFKLIDVREWMENKASRIVGTDILAPTTSFYTAVEELRQYQSSPIILYCHVGSRSAHCQKILKDMAFSHVGNLVHGIVSYRGEIEQG
jgi:ferredoxin-thioredoxin reductase catalytic subunit/rhodanese-related sulfurtransferase